MHSKSHKVSPTPLERLLPISDVMELTSFSKATIYRKMAEEPPTFPAPLKIGRSRVAWKSSAISEWIAQQASTATSASSDHPFTQK
ncbi:MAG: helix-turn-helix transcriptional regulator [Hyphomicrobiaceae bacterium]